MFEKRTYRDWIRSADLSTFRIIRGETDLMIAVDSSVDLNEAKAITDECVMFHRRELKRYITQHREFLEALRPIAPDESAPQIVQEMIAASAKANVGPMAAVAGAFAEITGKALRRISQQVIVENGGDIFIDTKKQRRIGIFAGDSPFTGKLSFRIDPEDSPVGVCTSSGVVGHSLSFGKANAVTIYSKSTPLADAVATATGNVVNSVADIEPGIEFARSIEGVLGVVIVVQDKIGMWGNIVKLDRGGKNGR